MSTPDPGASALSAALVREIKAEMGRHEIRSVRALARLLDDNNVYWNDRLNKKEGRVVISTEDLFRLASVLDVEPWDLLYRAAVVSRGGSKGGQMRSRKETR